MERKPDVGLPKVEKPTLFKRIKAVLSVAAQLVIAAPLKLPPQVVRVATYISLALSVLDALEDDGQQPKEGDDDVP